MNKSTRITPLFGNKIDRLLVSIGFHYDGPGIGKNPSYDFKIGDDYRRRLRIYYNRDVHMVYNTKIILFCMDTPSVIHIKEEDDITKELLLGFIQVCKNPVTPITTNFSHSVSPEKNKSFLKKYFGL